MERQKMDKSVVKKLASRLKLVIVGDGCVGKTSLLYAFGANTFLENHHEPTVFENYVTSIMVNKKEVELNLCDTAGQEDLDRLRPLSYSEADVILICFSVSDTTSFLNVANKWRPETQHYRPHAPVILVATKKDLRVHDGTRPFLERYGQAALQTDEGCTMAMRIRADAYIECSSKTFEGVHSVFQIAANLGQKFHKKNSTSCTLQ
ncbi:rho-related GTP-binding protein RhoC [Folsomia candida]|uniref:Rho-related GTP-binding protein RhoB n=1 Tax=Folsomia candida TaxID=158441 RepID=A0A226ERH9_FOLCA|nr:rho-related GTP-binding protein RhoC [Folsomia candida]OXA59654.1 Rho-related GTP-binding protein RhoB [Folsomia candida]